ncbi:AAA family ATPase [Mycolicibacterium peregrinum]|uniref:AAA family ATPase n=1 Tax=Mycolicibacterium peregrinum TaxID=43304 RepID=UPI0006D7EA1D|nr:AAA family ATPase [Mycolicibacterium peregrinum]MCV7204657.1 AAA family ATPase [Mycolicibacterium peregrinum]ORW60075.1 hypothetical protein AWC21_11375 [Mycolicibacterium peregrinum]
MSAHDLILDALKRNGSTVNERGDRAMAQCPAHDDRNPSLSVGQRSDGKGTVVKCFAGCDTADVLAKLGLTMADLFDDAAMRDVWNPTRTYLYSDGRTVKRGLKSNGSKDFWQTGNRDGNALFHAERIGDAALVFVCEGEKDVEAVEAHGGVAVCSAMGAGNAGKADWSPLKGKTVVVCADADKAGEGYAATVVHELDGVAATVSVVRAAVGKDVADHLAAGLSLGELVPVADFSGTDEADPFERQVADHVERLRIQREAKRRVDDEDRPPIPLPQMPTLSELLTRPRPPTRYRIDKVAPVNARVILSAQYKAGKTTLVGNLIRSLVDGDPFLGRFTVNTTAQRVVLLDDELSEPMLLDWLEVQGITNTGAVIPVSLRGQVRALDLLDDRRRREWAARLADLGCDYLILDCLRPVLDALGLDENHDAGRFLVGFDALLRDAGIGDGTLVHHMGHNGERSRGDSRLLDWPDVNWRLVRETDEPDSPRFFSAYGRDVDIAEGGLGFDPAARRLVYSPGSRAGSKVEKAATAVILYLADHAKGGGTGLSGSAIEKADELSEHGRNAVRSGLKLAVERGVVAQRVADKGARIHSIAQPCEVCGRPVTRDGNRHLSCPAPGLLDDEIWVS